MDGTIKDLADSLNSSYELIYMMSDYVEDDMDRLMNIWENGDGDFEKWFTENVLEYYEVQDFPYDERKNLWYVVWGCEKFYFPRSWHIDYDD